MKNFIIVNTQKYKDKDICFDITMNFHVTKINNTFLGGGCIFTDMIVIWL